MPSWCLLVEGDLDAAVMERVVAHAGAEVLDVFGRRGIDYIRERLAGFARAAVSSPTLAVVDLRGSGADCAPDLLRAWEPPAGRLALRVAVPEIEAWLRPLPGSGARVGPLYNAHLRRFATAHWDIAAARGRSRSLDGCLRALGTRGS